VAENRLHALEFGDLVEKHFPLGARGELAEARVQLGEEVAFKSVLGRLVVPKLGLEKGQIWSISKNCLLKEGGQIFACEHLGLFGWLTF